MRKKIRYLPSSWLSGGLLGLLVLLFSTSLALAQTPTIITDKADYSPGETVTFTGSGFSYQLCRACIAARRQYCGWRWLVYVWVGYRWQ